MSFSCVAHAFESALIITTIDQLQHMTITSCHPSQLQITRADNTYDNRHYSNGTILIIYVIGHLSHINVINFMER